MKTSVLPVSAPGWLLLDAEGQTIGGIATKAAYLLRGKHKPSFSPHQPCGDHVVIVNLGKLKIEASKQRRKVYHDHTGYPGSMRTTTLERMLVKSPVEVIERAVKGMLRNNRLRPIFLKRLHLHIEAEHPYAAQKPASISITI